ncbi:MAG: hypothetical protein ABL888_19450 [Pirellulaceae bacterium]
MVIRDFRDVGVYYVARENQAMSDAELKALNHCFAIHFRVIQESTCFV